MASTTPNNNKASSLVQASQSQAHAHAHARRLMEVDTHRRLMEVARSERSAAFRFLRGGAFAGVENDQNEMFPFEEKFKWSAMSQVLTATICGIYVAGVVPLVYSVAMLAYALCK